MQLIIIAIAIVCTAALFSALKDRFENKPKEYLYITKRHLDGDVLPSPGAKIIFQDKSQTKVYFSVYPNNRQYVSTHWFQNYINGPEILLNNGTLMTPTQFWLSVKSINGIEVVVPASLENK